MGGPLAALRRWRKKASRKSESAKSSPASALVAKSSQVVTVDLTPASKEINSETEPPPGCPYHKGAAAESTAPPPGCPYHQAVSAADVTPKVEITEEVKPAEAAAWPRAEPNAKQKKLAFTRMQANVDELLEKHAAAVTTLRAAVASDANFASGGTAAVPYDDLWLLRFILSNGEKEAEKAAKATLTYRAENAWMMQLAAEGKAHPQKDEMSALSISEIWSKPTLADEPVQLIRGIHIMGAITRGFAACRLAVSLP